jgi:hypothetical protein
MHQLRPLPSANFSLDPNTLADILRYAKPLGHHEDAASLNLGFGFLYYGLARALRPRHVVVVGSGFGFSVVCLALGLKDNRQGALTFIDPSYSVIADGPFRTMGGTAQWNTPQKVHERFARFGLGDIVTHYRTTSEVFFADYARHGLPAIDIGFIDGNHSYESVRHDFLALLAQSRRNSYILLHDTNIYVRELIRHAGVKRWLKRVIRRPQDFEVLDLPFSSGVAMVHVLRDGPWALAAD